MKSQASLRSGTLMRPTFQYRRNQSASIASTTSLTCSSTCSSTDDTIVLKSASSSYQYRTTTSEVPPGPYLGDPGNIDADLSMYLRDAELIREQERILQQIYERVALTSGTSSVRPASSFVSNDGQGSALSSARPHPERPTPRSVTGVLLDDRGNSSSLREYLQETTAHLEERATRFVALSSYVRGTSDANDNWTDHPPSHHCQRHPDLAQNLSSCEDEEDTSKTVDDPSIYQGTLESIQRSRHEAGTIAASTTTSIDVEQRLSNKVPSTFRADHHHHRRPVGMTQTDNRKCGHADRSICVKELERSESDETCIRQRRHHHSARTMRMSTILSKDQVIPVGPNTTLHVRGTARTYDAIASGDAILVQCAACLAVLQIGRSAKLLYCGVCENVTPVELAREQAVTNPWGVFPSAGASVGCSSAMDDEASSLSLRYRPSATLRMDSHIARTVQNQEMDVACARKLARMHQEAP
jgi:hypothetical protein